MCVLHLPVCLFYFYLCVYSIFTCVSILYLPACLFYFYLWGDFPLHYASPFSVTLDNLLGLRVYHRNFPSNFLIAIPSLTLKVHKKLKLFHQNADIKKKRGFSPQKITWKPQKIIKRKSKYYFNYETKHDNYSKKNKFLCIPKFYLILIPLERNVYTTCIRNIRPPHPQK